MLLESLCHKHSKNSIMYSVPIEINQYNVNSKQFQYLWSFTGNTVWVVFEGHITDYDMPPPPKICIPDG